MPINLIRDSQGRYAVSKAKDTVAVIITCLIVLSITYAAYAQTKQRNEGRVQQNTPGDTQELRPSNSGSFYDINDGGTEESCIVSGSETYCAGTPGELIRGIKLDQAWNSKPEVKTIEAKPVPPKSAYQRKGSNPEIEKMARAEAEKQGFKDINLLLDLIDCESTQTINGKPTWNPEAKNTRGNNPSWSTDWGILQYNDYHQRKNITIKCSLDPACALAKGVSDLKAGRICLWSCANKIRPNLCK